MDCVISVSYQRAAWGSWRGPSIWMFKHLQFLYGAWPWVQCTHTLLQLVQASCLHAKWTSQNRELLTTNFTGAIKHKAIHQIRTCIFVCIHAWSVIVWWKPIHQQICIVRYVRWNADPLHVSKGRTKNNQVCNMPVREGCAQVYFTPIIHSQITAHYEWRYFQWYCVKYGNITSRGSKFRSAVTCMPINLINDSPMSRVAKGLSKYGLVVKRAEWWSGMTKCVTMATLWVPVEIMAGVTHTQIINNTRPHQQLRVAKGLKIDWWYWKVSGGQARPNHCQPEHCYTIQQSPNKRAPKSFFNALL